VAGPSTCPIGASNTPLILRNLFRLSPFLHRLSCGHIFCYDCIDAVFNAHSWNELDPCPTCESPMFEPPQRDEILEGVATWISRMKGEIPASAMQVIDPEHFADRFREGRIRDLRMLMTQTDAEQTDAEQTDAERMDTDWTDADWTDAEETDTEQTDTEQTDTEQTDTDTGDADMEETDTEQAVVRYSSHEV
jgi:Zinc finger, C3HC4 type (RING finger)